jgi:hypothetical protein
MSGNAFENDSQGFEQGEQQSSDLYPTNTGMQQQQGNHGMVSGDQQRSQGYDGQQPQTGEQQVQGRGRTTTHFPSHTPEEVFSKPVLNPLSSIPSYHNFVYEQMNKLRNHSTRASVEVWLKWRDEFFGNELRA